MRFDPNTGTNVLRVCSTSQSSANQPAGGAGRTEPGKCYGIYSYRGYQSMPSQQEPEIRKGHLGVAVRRFLALGIKNVRELDFVGAPSYMAIDPAVGNLVQIGAVLSKDDTLELTDDGHRMVKLEICLRNRALPPDLMKRMVNKFGPDLSGIKEKVPEAEFTVDARRHVIRVRGNKVLEQRAEELIYEFAHSCNVNGPVSNPGGEMEFEAAINSLLSTLGFLYQRSLFLLNPRQIGLGPTKPE
ncbi:RNA helicase [Sarracenia purpurea var. burkii]